MEVLEILSTYPQGVSLDKISKITGLSYYVVKNTVKRLQDSMLVENTRVIENRAYPKKGIKRLVL